MSFKSLVLSQFVCIPWMRSPFQGSLENPADHGMENTVNVNIPVRESEDVIGAWFVHPKKDSSTSEQQTDYDVGAGEIAFLYLHGNADTRASGHRMELYKVLQRLGYHVLAIDYRSYADSTFIWRPNEETMSTDALSAYGWLLGRCHPDAKVFVWGHSLGSGVTGKTAWRLPQTEPRLAMPSGIVLESPFSSLHDEIRTFNASTFLPFDIQKELASAQMEFNSVENLKAVQTPILILHAKDDQVIPFELGEKLASELRASCDVTFTAFDEDLKLGHTDIYYAQALPATIQNFVATSIEKSNSKL